MSKKNNSYSKELKLQAVDMYLNQGLSQLLIVKELNIKSHTQVQNWLKSYSEKGNTAFDKETRGRVIGSRKGRPKTKFKSIKEELKYLRMENEFLKKVRALHGH
jgi:transposase